MKQYEILLVDDDPFILIAIGHALENQGYQVTTADSGVEAAEIIAKKNFDLVITDLVMDSIDGIGILKRSKEKDPEVMVIILTGYGDMRSAINALRLDADDYLLKPCEPEEIFFRVSRCLEKREFKKKIKFYEEILPVCCQCKKIRDDGGKEPGSGQWVSLEKFAWEKAKIKVTSSYCPTCLKEMSEEINKIASKEQEL